VRVVVAVRLPETPVIVTLYCPTLAELLAESVRVLVLVVGFGVQSAATPLGRPETERVTLPVKPYWGLTYKYEVPELP